MTLLPEKIRNVAIIAHIDHGKTTLVDSLLRAAHMFRSHEIMPDRVMDSYDQERERGITIFSKNTSLLYDGYTINLVDTPGHADFSGEVERVLDMVNSVLLLVDAQEGPKPQTRFVLSQALKRGYKPIVIVNKIDRPHADPERVLTETFDLFVELGATDEQLDFNYCYCSGLAGFACHDYKIPSSDMAPLFQTIIDHVPPPKGDPEAPFLMQTATVSYDSFLGRGATGRILQGTIRKGDQVTHFDSQGAKMRMRVTHIHGTHGLQKVEQDKGFAGDILTLYGIPDVLVGDTLCDPDHEVRLPLLHIEEPTLSIEMMINSGPMVGQEGKHVNMNKLKERLLKEKKANITLKIEEVPDYQDRMKISGRGELHLAVLVEAMRREGFEMCLSQPRVITHMNQGVKEEPQEKLYVEVPEEHSGTIIELLSLRKGEMTSLTTNDLGITCMEFLIPTRGLIGWRHDFLTITRGRGIATTLFDSYTPWRGPIPRRKNGVLVSMNRGKATAYACFTLQNRGILFVAPGDEVYEGMIVGEHLYENDLSVNITKEKALTNVRAAGKDENLILTTPKKLSLEQAIDFIADDELVEVTPHSIRFRKVHLKEQDRKRLSRSEKK